MFYHLLRVQAVAVGESHACEAGPAEAEIVDAANAALAEAVDNDGHENADAAIRGSC